MTHSACFDSQVMNGGTYSWFSNCPGVVDPVVYVDGPSWWAGKFLGWSHKRRGIWSDSPRESNPYKSHDPLLCR